MVPLSIFAKYIGLTLDMVLLLQVENSKSKYVKFTPVRRPTELSAPSRNILPTGLEELRPNL